MGRACDLRISGFQERESNACAQRCSLCVYACAFSLSARVCVVCSARVYMCAPCALSLWGSCVISQSLIGRGRKGGPTCSDWARTRATTVGGAADADAGAAAAAAASGAAGVGAAASASGTACGARAAACGCGCCGCASGAAGTCCACCPNSWTSLVRPCAVTCASGRAGFEIREGFDIREVVGGCWVGGRWVVGGWSVGGGWVAGGWHSPRCR